MLSSLAISLRVGGGYPSMEFATCETPPGLGKSGRPEVVGQAPSLPPGNTHSRTAGGR